MKKLVIPILLMFLVFCLFTLNVFVPAHVLPYAITIVMFFILSAAIYYGNRKAGPYIIKISLWMVGCFSLGIGLYIGTDNFTYFLLGILGIPFIILWISYLRYPPHLWKYVWLFRKKRQSEAAQYINEWLRSHPDDWKAYMMRSDFHLNRGQIAEGERDSRMVIKLKPDFHEGYNQLGRSLMVMGQYEEARQAFESANKLKPNSGYLANLGSTCYRLGDFPAAVQALTKATRRPLDYQLYTLTANYYLGRSLENVGEQKKALDAFKNMKLYAADLDQYIAQFNAAPDYPGTVVAREDLLDIQRRLKT
jgi:Flp pilus assembly protein TadD